MESENTCGLEKVIVPKLKTAGETKKVYLPANMGIEEKYKFCSYII